MADIPLINDYDFSDLTNEELDREIEIVQLILDQIARMITENEAQIALDNDTINREKMITVLTAETSFQTDKLTALNQEKARRG